MLPELIALRAVFGQDEANHGTTRYRVDGVGLVHVPPEAIGFLISKGGFALAKTTAAVAVKNQPTDSHPNCLMRLHHDDAAGCSYAGRNYPSDQNGDVLVPAEAAADLMAHGFVPVPERNSRYQTGVVKAGGAGNTIAGGEATGSAARDERSSGV